MGNVLVNAAPFVCVLLLGAVGGTLDGDPCNHVMGGNIGIIWLCRGWVMYWLYSLMRHLLWVPAESPFWGFGSLGLEV